jgi:hypothetical protein
MNIDLKPCPFCGSSAKDGYHPGTEVYPQSFWVECSNSACGVSSPSYYGSSTWHQIDAEDERVKIKAAAWWNRRPTAEHAARETDARQIAESNGGVA